MAKKKVGEEGEWPKREEKREKFRARNMPELWAIHSQLEEVVMAQRAFRKKIERRKRHQMVRKSGDLGRDQTGGFCEMGRGKYLTF